MRKLTAILCLTLAVLLGNAAGAVANSEYEKPVTVKGSEPDTSLTVQLSKDKKTFRATIKIEMAKSECLGKIGNDGLISSEECVFQTAEVSETYFSGIFPNFLLNAEKTCLVAYEAIFWHPERCSFLKPVTFKYPHSIETKAIATAEEKKRKELAKKAAEEKKRQELAKQAAEEKKQKAVERRTAFKSTIPSNRGGEVKAATGSEYEKTVTVKGSEPDSSLTVQISSDGKKFRATIEIESNKSKPCSGTIGSDGKIKSEECEIPSIMNGYSRLTGKFPNFIFNEFGECLGIISGNTCASDAIDTPFSFKYPLSIETKAIATAEEKKRQELAKKAAEEKKRRELAKKAAEEKKRQELAKKADEEKKRRELAKKAAQQMKQKAIERRSAEKSTIPKIGGSGALEQQLAILKKLHSNGLIDDQEFKTKKEYLLSRFLGLNTEPPTKVASAAKPQISARKKVLERYSDVKFGNYHALVIGSNNYEHLPKLTTAETDAKSVAKTLKNKYEFKVRTLINPKRQDILDQFDEYREQLTGNDNLLIYYAGHGYLDEQTNRGYWMPVDARPNRRSAWLANADITATLKGLKANHVMVVSDSCYSGTLTRGLVIKKKTPDYVREVVSKKARVVITSGGLEPVEDKSGGKNSPFASVFLDVLNSNEGVLDGTQMFNKMRRPVMLKTEQTPAYSDVRRAGHEGGDFLFVRRR